MSSNGIYWDKTKQITSSHSSQIRRNLATTNTAIRAVSLQIFDSREVWGFLAPVAASCSSALCDVLKRADNACKSSWVSGMLMRPNHQRAVSCQAEL